MKYGTHLRGVAADEAEWGDTPQHVRERCLRTEAALKRLKIHPLLTRRAGPLEQSALRIVREALRAAR